MTSTICFFLEKKKLLPRVCVTAFWFSVVMGSLLWFGVCLCYMFVCCSAAV